MVHAAPDILQFIVPSQRVQALTCPRCMALDHSKAECALSTLEPAQELPRIRQTDTGRQSGPPWKRFRRDGTPTYLPHSQRRKLRKYRTASYSMRASASATPSRAIGSTSASVAERITALQTAQRPLSLPLPQHREVRGLKL